MCCPHVAGSPRRTAHLDGVLGPSVVHANDRLGQAIRMASIEREGLIGLEAVDRLETDLDRVAVFGAEGFDGEDADGDALGELARRTPLRDQEAGPGDDGLAGFGGVHKKQYALGWYHPQDKSSRVVTIPPTPKSQPSLSNARTPAYAPRSPPRPSARSKTPPHPRRTSTPAVSEYG